MARQAENTLKENLKLVPILTLFRIWSSNNFNFAFLCLATFILNEYVKYFMFFCGQPGRNPSCAAH